MEEARNLVRTRGQTPLRRCSCARYVLPARRDSQPATRNLSSLGGRVERRRFLWAFSYVRNIRRLVIGRRNRLASAASGHGSRRGPIQRLRRSRGAARRRRRRRTAATATATPPGAVCPEGSSAIAFTVSRGDGMRRYEGVAIPAPVSFSVVHSTVQSVLFAGSTRPWGRPVEDRPVTPGTRGQTPLQRRSGARYVLPARRGHHPDGRSTGLCTVGRPEGRFLWAFCCPTADNRRTAEA